jgi:transposase-like protein
LTSTAGGYGGRVAEQAESSAPAGDSLTEVLLSVADPRLRSHVGSLGLDEGARVYVEELRWPHGANCPRCASDRPGWLDVRRKYYCRDCGYQFRVTAGTVFHDSHVSLARWLVAVQMMIRSERGHPATQLWTLIGGSYKTAWFVNHRIRAAMSRSLLDLGMPLALAHTLPPVRDAGEPTEPGAAGEAGHGWALVRRLVAGRYHCPSSEHLGAYWDEARWRAAHADDADVFRETVRALLEAEPLQYRELTDHTRLPNLPAAP